MRILWLCNIVPPAVARQLNIETTVKEGWISGTLNRLSKVQGDDITLGICMPVNDIDGMYKKDTVHIDSLEITCYRFLEQTVSPWVYDETLEQIAKKVIEDFKPDMIHSFGTEYPHTLAWAKVFNCPEKMFISIQGVMKACTEAYCGGLPKSVVDGQSFRDFIKKDNIAAQRDKFAKRAEFEEKALKLTGHVAGRTAFDKEEILKINSDITYHYMGETLRNEFYSGEWNEEALNTHTIFVSQADYPLKGFHTLLEAMPEIIKKYPDTHVYVAGNSITGYKTIKEKIKIGTYGNYLRKLIKSHGIEDKISVLGKLSAEEMKQRYIESAVYICTSFVENSPNSMGEAMLLGTPVIATRTGGIPSMAEEAKEVILFTPGDSSELANAVINLFGNSDFAVKLSKAEKERAARNHDSEKNFESLMEIYKKICQ